MIPTLKPTMLY